MGSPHINQSTLRTHVEGNVDLMEMVLEQYRANSDHLDEASQSLSAAVLTLAEVKADARATTAAVDRLVAIVQGRNGGPSLQSDVHELKHNTNSLCEWRDTVNARLWAIMMLLFGTLITTLVSALAVWLRG